MFIIVGEILGKLKFFSQSSDLGSDAGSDLAFDVGIY